MASHELATIGINVTKNEIPKKQQTNKNEAKRSGDNFEYSNDQKINDKTP